MKWTILAVLAFLWAFPALAGPAEDAATAAAKTWLTLIDAKNYTQAYKSAADIFHQGISEARWEKMAASGREAAGASKSREFQAAELTKSLPGMPDGDYANVAFQTEFETKGASTEIVTLVRENGKWKVGGYHIN